MARKVRSPKLDTRSARLKIEIRREPHWTRLASGLALGYRRTAGPQGFWIARRYLPDGTPKLVYQSLGPADDLGDSADALTFDQAQETARAWHAKLMNPAPSAGAVTVADALAAYVAYLRAERRTGYDAERRLRKHVGPALGARRIADLTASDVEAFKRSMVRRDDADPEVERRSKDSANRVLRSFKAAMNRLAADPGNGIVSDAAWRRVLPFRLAGRARQVHLSLAECQRLINASSGAFRNLVIAALTTGCRPPGELAGLLVRDLRADLRILSLRRGKTGARDVFLTEEGAAFLAGLAAGRPGDALLLPRDDGSPWARSDHGRPMQDAVKRAGLPSDVTIYALRHTHASHALSAGMNLQLLAENMGTSVRMIELHYGKFIAARRLELIEQAAPKFGLKKPGVVPMPAAVR